MLIVHDTYKVNFYPKTANPQESWLVSFRVPAPELEQFVRVLIFNGVTAFDCSKEGEDAR